MAKELEVILRLCDNAEVKAKYFQDVQSHGEAQSAAVAAFKDHLDKAFHYPDVRKPDFKYDWDDHKHALALYNEYSAFNEVMNEEVLLHFRIFVECGKFELANQLAQDFKLPQEKTKEQILLAIKYCAREKDRALEIKSHYAIDDGDFKKSLLQALPCYEDVKIVESFKDIITQEDITNTYVVNFSGKFPENILRDRHELLKIGYNLPKWLVECAAFSFYASGKPKVETSSCYMGLAEEVTTIANEFILPKDVPVFMSYVKECNFIMAAKIGEGWKERGCQFEFVDKVLEISKTINK
jgi:hypothetical protein